MHNGSLKVQNHRSPGGVASSSKYRVLVLARLKSTNMIEYRMIWRFVSTAILIRCRRSSFLLEFCYGPIVDRNFVISIRGGCVRYFRSDTNAFVEANRKSPATDGDSRSDICVPELIPAIEFGVEWPSIVRFAVGPGSAHSDLHGYADDPSAKQTIQFRSAAEMFHSFGMRQVQNCSANGISAYAMPVRFPSANSSVLRLDPSRLALYTEPPKSVTNIRPPFRSRARPMPSIK